jgi:hypothetical protein
MSTNLYLQDIEQSVLDNDSFSIIKNMIKEWDEHDNKQYLHNITKPKFNRVINQIQNFHFCVWDQYTYFYSEMEYGDFESYYMLYLIYKDNETRNLDYGF